MPSRCSPDRCPSTRIPRSRKPPKLPVRTGSSRPAPPTGAGRRVPGPPSHAQSEEKGTGEADPHLIIPPSSVPQLVGACPAVDLWRQVARCQGLFHLLSGRVGPFGQGGTSRNVPAPVPVVRRPT